MKTLKSGQRLPRTRSAESYAFSRGANAENRDNWKNGSTSYFGSVANRASFAPIAGANLAP